MYIYIYIFKYEYIYIKSLDMAYVANKVHNANFK